MARPTKLTPDIQNMIVDLIKEGQFAETAANCVGITERTFYNWMQRGKNEQHGSFFQFFQAIQQASAKSEVKAVEIIWNAAENDWRAAAWFLEKRFPDKWGKRYRTRVTDQYAYPAESNLEEAREWLLRKIEAYHGKG